MENQVRMICCSKDTHVWRVFITLSIILYLAKFSAFFPTQWFRQGKGMKEWKGNMFSVYSSGGLIKKQSYSTLAEYYCAEQTKFEYTYSQSQISYNDAGALCNRFGALSSGISAFIAFSVISFIIGICLNLLFAFGKTKLCKLNCGIALNFLQVACEFACLVSIGASSQFTLYGNCHYLSIESTNSSVYNMNSCLGVGGIFSFFCSWLILVFNVTMMVFICLYKGSKEIVEEPAPEAQIVMPRSELSRLEQNTPYSNPVYDTYKPVDMLGNIDDDMPVENVD